MPGNVLNSQFQRNHLLHTRYKMESYHLAHRKKVDEQTIKGDSGGPLVCVSSGVWTLTGVTSWGIGCGDERSPGIYTNIAKYTRWINHFINEN